MSPTHSSRAGEPRATPKGTPLEGRNPQSYWTAKISNGNWPGKSLSDAIDEAITQSAAHKDFFRGFRSGGGRIEFFVGWFFEGNSGDVFDAELMARLAALNIDLSLDIYPPDQPQSGI